MATKHERVYYLYHVRGLLRVVLRDILQYLNLHQRLRIVLRFVLYNLQRHCLLFFVVERFEYLPKGAFAEQVLNLIAVPDVVVVHNLHFALFIVEIVLVLGRFLPPLAQTVYYRVSQHFSSFVGR